MIFFFFCGFNGCGGGDGGCCGYGLVVWCLIFFFFPCGFGGCGGGLVTMMVVWFFILFVGLVVSVFVVVVMVVVAVVVAVADGRGVCCCGCGWC